MYEIIAEAGKSFDDIENMIYEFAVEAEERFDEARERFDDLDVQVDDITGDGGIGFTRMHSRLTKVFSVTMVPLISRTVSSFGIH